MVETDSGNTLPEIEAVALEVRRLLFGDTLRLRRQSEELLRCWLNERWAKENGVHCECRVMSCEDHTCPVHDRHHDNPGLTERGCDNCSGLCKQPVMSSVPGEPSQYRCPLPLGHEGGCRWIGNAPAKP